MAIKGLFEHQRGCTPLRPCTSCEALAFLRSQLAPDTFEEFCRIATGTREPKKVSKARSASSLHVDTIPLSGKLDDYLELSAPALSALKKGGIKTIGDLLKFSRSDLRESMEIDGRAVRGLVAQLGKLGLQLK